VTQHWGVLDTAVTVLCSCGLVLKTCRLMCVRYSCSSYKHGPDPRHCPDSVTIYQLQYDIVMLLSSVADLLICWLSPRLHVSLMTLLCSNHSSHTQWHQSTDEIHCVTSCLHCWVTAHRPLYAFVTWLTSGWSP